VGEPNDALRAARERLPSRRAPGESLSRPELAEAISAWLWHNTGKRYDLDHHLIGKWERGVVARPISPYRAALRAVLGVGSDVELGFVDRPDPVRAGAVRLAKAGGHVTFGAFALAALARLLLDAERPQDALEVVAIAQRGTRHSSTPALRSMLAVRQAWGHAQRGEPHAFARAVDDAQTAHASVVASAEPHWLNGFDRAELHGTIGARHRDLARHHIRYAHSAVPYIERALTERNLNRARNRAFDLVSLARVHLLTGEHDHATYTIRNAVAHVDPVRPGRLARKVADWHREAGAHASNPAVRAMRDEIVALLPRSA
jgi:hypothetical protein